MKHPFGVSRGETALLVIDMQESLRATVPHFDDLVHNIARLVLTFQMFDMPVLVTEQDPENLGSTIDPIRKLFKFLEVTEKIEFSALDNPHFLAQLNPLKVTSFVVCGAETHISVNQTVLALLNHGMNVHVVADAANSRRNLDHTLALRKMELAGAHITTTEMGLFELAQKAGTESFKNIQRMVRGKFIPGGRPKPLAAAASVPLEETKQAMPNEPNTLGDAEVSLPQTSVSEEVSSANTTSQQEEQSASNAPAAQTIEASQPAPDFAAQDTPDISAVNDILDSIGDEPDALTAHSDKTENEINKELSDIDSLLGNLQGDDTKE